MFCVNCGKAYDPSHKFCNHCGHPLPSSTGERGASPDSAVGETQQPLHKGAPSQTQDQAAPPSAPNEPTQAAPYAAFVICLLGSALLISITVFNIADALVRSRWRDLDTILTSVLALAAILVVRRARNIWRRGMTAEADEKVRRERQHLIRSGVIIGLVFIGIAIVVGAAIGRNGAAAAQLVQLNVDIEHMSAVGDRISKARSAVEFTVDSYLQMYKVIDPEVQDFESTLRRLKTELAAYDARTPPERRAQNRETINAVEIGLRRAELLKQQILVAKQLEPLDATRQWAGWQSQMLPLLASEDALDKPK